MKVKVRWLGFRVRIQSERIIIIIIVFRDSDSTTIRFNNEPNSGERYDTYSALH